MKIAGTRSSIVALPADEPLAGAAENPNGKRPIVTLEVQTDDGAVGVGATYFGGALTGTLKSAVEELGALCVGEDPVRVEMVTAKLRAAAGSAGPGGIFNLAHSALDMALWDIRGKALSLPLCGTDGSLEPIRNIGDPLTFIIRLVPGLEATLDPFSVTQLRIRNGSSCPKPAPRVVR